MICVKGGSYMKKNKLAIITARGGSKRIPKKNIKEFCGKPIILYSIEAALKAEIFQEVMVSTDDREIADLAKRAGASVPFMRSEATSNDFATTDEVILEVLKEYEKKGKTFDSFCCIYPTAPFITSERLKEAMELLDGADSVMPVVPFSYPPQRGLLINEKGKIERQFPEYLMVRSQDLPKIYHDSGQFYACRTEVFLKEKTTDVNNLVPLILSELEVQDIDTIEDWELAEIKFLRRENGGK